MRSLDRNRDALPCPIPSDDQMAGPPALAISFHTMSVFEYLNDVQLRKTMAPEFVGIFFIEEKAMNLRR